MDKKIPCNRPKNEPKKFYRQDRCNNYSRVPNSGSFLNFGYFLWAPDNSNCFRFSLKVQLKDQFHSRRCQLTSAPHPLPPLAGGRVNLRGYVRANFNKLYTGGGGGYFGFNDWNDNNEVAFSTVLLEWARIFSDFFRVGQFFIFTVSKRTRMFVLYMKNKACFIQSKKMGQFITI